MRILVGLLLGLAAGYSYGFYDGRHNTQPTVVRLVKGFKRPSASAIQHAESLKADAEAKLQQNADEKLKAAQ
jgi:hypothetical protein